MPHLARTSDRVLTFVFCIGIGAACGDDPKPFKPSPNEIGGRTDAGAPGVLDAAHETRQNPGADATGSADGSGPEHTDGSTPSDSGSGTADFASRCAAPGVLVCEGFDDTTDFVKSDDEGLRLPWAGNALLGFQDTVIKASGESALRFDIHGRTQADVAGSFVKSFGRSFGENSTFYVQFQQRFDANMLAIDWNGLMGTSWKQAVFYGAAGGTCQQVELATGNYRYGAGHPMMYSACGDIGMDTNLTRSSWVCPTCTPKLVQQGASDTDGYNCPYGTFADGTGNGVGCFRYPADTFVTFYYKVHIGDWGQPNSAVMAWVALGGQSYKQWINVPNVSLHNDYTSQNNDYSKIMLTPYMTEKNSSVDHPTAHTWYDELIVSTQPIAAPQ